MVEVNKDWETRLDRFLEVCPVPFSCEVHSSPGILYLSIQEKERLREKIALVSRSCEEMCKEMLKGTIKYPTDDWSEEEYEKMFTQEFWGLVNYRLLMTRKKNDS